MAKQQNPQGQQQPKDPIVLRLEFPIASPIAGSGNYSQRVVGIVTQGQKAIQIGALQFYLNGNPYGGSVLLNSDGRAVKDMIVPVGVQHTIGVAVSGTGISVSEERLLPKPEIKKPSEFSIIPMVTDKLVELIVKVSGPDGGSLKDVDVSVYELNGSLHSHPFKTNADGEVKHSVGLQPGKKTEVVIIVSGFSADKVFRRTFEGK